MTYHAKIEANATLADVLSWAKASGENSAAIRELEKVPARLGLVDEDIGLIDAGIRHFEAAIVPSPYGMVSGSKDMAAAARRGNSRLRALLKRFHSRDQSAIASPDIAESYTALMQAVEAREGHVRQQGIFAKGRHRSLVTLRARCNVALPDLDQAEIDRIYLDATTEKRKCIIKALRLIDELMRGHNTWPEFRPLLPTKPLMVPRISARARRICWESLPAQFREDAEAVFGRMLLTQTEIAVLIRDLMKDGLSSSEIDAHVAAMTLNRKRRPANSGSALAGYKSAVTWLVRSEQDAASGSQTLRDLHGLMSRDRIMAAIDEQIARSEGEIELKDPRKSQTLANRLTNLRTVARHGLKDPEIVAHIDLLKEVYKEFVLSPKEMTEEAERFCRLLKHRPEIAARLVNAPRRLADLAEKDLATARAAGNRLHEEQALRLYAAAVLFAIQLSRPLRTSNLVSLRHRGSAEIGGNLRWVKKSSHAELRFAKGEIKNDRSIAVHVVGDDAAILHAWMSQHRPRFLELRGLSDTPYVFPGSAKPRFVKDAISLPEGCISPAAMVELWDLGERKLGLGITPHQIRHAVATLILSLEPGNFAKAASVLGDTEETVRRHYGQDSGQAAAQAVRGALLAHHPSMFKLMKGRFE